MIWTGKYFTDYLRPGYSAISYVDPTEDTGEHDVDEIRKRLLEEHDIESNVYDPSDERTWE